MSSVKVQNDEAIAYLTDNLTDKQAGVDQLHRLMSDLGNSVVAYPKWHSIHTMEFKTNKKNRYYVKQYKQNVLSEVHDGTAALFAGGYIVFPQTEEKADEIKELVDKLQGLYEGLYAEVLDVPPADRYHFSSCNLLRNNRQSQRKIRRGNFRRRIFGRKLWFRSLEGCLDWVQ